MIRSVASNSTTSNGSNFLRSTIRWRQTKNLHQTHKRLLKVLNRMPMEPNRATWDRSRKLTSTSTRWAGWASTKTSRFCSPFAKSWSKSPSSCRQIRGREPADQTTTPLTTALLTVSSNWSSVCWPALTLTSYNSCRKFSSSSEASCTRIITLRTQTSTRNPTIACWWTLCAQLWANTSLGKIEDKFCLIWQLCSTICAPKTTPLSLLRGSNSSPTNCSCRISWKFKLCTRRR